jgi:Ca2+-binding RTX toxin-like protein
MLKRSRRLALPIVILLAVMALPATALADGSTLFDGTGLVVDVDDAEPVTNHDITISSTDGTAWTITEGNPLASLPAAAGPECTGGGLVITCDTGVVVPTYVEVRAGAGDDHVTLDTSGGANLVSLHAFGESGDDVIRGDAGDDVLRGQDALADVANEGNDVLYGGCGADVFTGGGGTDTVSYDDSAACPQHNPVTVTLDGNANDGAPGEHDDVGGQPTAAPTSASIENIVGTADTGIGDGDDTITGDFGPNGIDALGGDDHVDGREGSDSLGGGDGGDTLVGGAGADQLAGGAGGDTFTADDGEVDAIDCGGDANNNGTIDADDVRVGCSDPSNVFTTPPPAPSYGPGSIAAGGGVLTIDTADPSPVDHAITVVDGSPNLTIVQAPGGPALPAPGAGCAAGGDVRTVTCTAALVTSIVAFAGNGNDTIDVHQANRASSLYGEDGFDVLVGGNMPDHLVGDQEPEAVAGDGGDLLVGGCDVDTYVGGGGVDTVSFRSDGCTFHQTTGVGASLDDAANDGFEDENVGGASNSIEALEGGAAGDVLTGNDLDNVLTGGPGDDSILPGGGRDVVLAQDGDDEVNARDGAQDSVDCGAGSDELVADPADEAAGCEAVDDGTTTTPPPPPPSPTVPAGGGTAGGVVFGRVTDTTRRKPFPEVRGMQYAAVQNLLNRNALAGKGPYVEWRPSATRYGSARSGGPLGRNPTGGTWQEGDVLAVTYRDGTKVFTAPGHLVSTGAATPVAVTLTLYGGTTKDSCLQDGKDLAGLPWDDYQAAMRSLHCKVDDVRVQLPRTTTTKGEVDVNSGDRCEAARKVAKAGSGRIDETISVPESARLSDLRVYVMESAQGASLRAGTGTLHVSADGRSAFQLYVGGRVSQYQAKDGRWVNQFLDHATVYVDASAVGGGTFVKTTGIAGLAPGTAEVVLPTIRPGRIRIAATWSDSRGQMICGGGHVDVTGPYPTGPAKGRKFGTTFDTEMGRTWGYTGTGWKRVTASAKHVVGRSTARGGVAATATWWDTLTGWLSGLFGRSQPSVAASVGSTQASVLALDTNLKAKVAHLNLGSGAGEGHLAAYSLITNDGGSIVATGGGNIVATGGGNIISTNGGGIVAQGAGNMVFGYSPQAGIVATGGGNLIGNDGAGIVAQGAGNIVASGAGNIVSTSGGAIVASGGGNLVGAGGSNIVAQGGGNIVATGGGN